MSNIHLDRIDRLNSLLRDQPNDAFLLFALAKEHDALGNDDAALQLYQQLLEYHPEYLGAYYHLAELLWRNAKIEDATKVANAGIELANTSGNQKDLAELIQLRDSF